ncbi:hypothetical protein PLANTIT3_100130 [Plantibacter sp. T3]|nr:hypothetical protein PLANTIT3_100130 [Plantibacter sp. T3]
MHAAEAAHTNRRAGEGFGHEKSSGASARSWGEASLDQIFIHLRWTSRHENLRLSRLHATVTGGLWFRQP